MSKHRSGVTFEQQFTGRFSPLSTGFANKGLIVAFCSIQRHVLGLFLEFVLFGEDLT